METSGQVDMIISLTAEECDFYAYGPLIQAHIRTIRNWLAQNWFRGSNLLSVQPRIYWTTSSIYVFFIFRYPKFFAISRDSCEDSPIGCACTSPLPSAIGACTQPSSYSDQL